MDLVREEDFHVDVVCHLAFCFAVTGLLWYICKLLKIARPTGPI